MSDHNTDQIILITPNPTDTPPGGDGLIPKPLVDGGVAVAVIIAITYFTQKLLKSVVEVMKVNKKGK
ncbi:MAG TPA: hypothetical protein V6D37_12565 [Candidatus Sericytochromatia bacterium]